MFNTQSRIWHSVFFGLLNSAQHYVKTPQWLLDWEEKQGGERFREESTKEKWRTSSQKRIGMDLEIDES